MAWYMKLHWRIIGGLLAGMLFGIIAAIAGWAQFTADWITPFGTIFISSLKLIGVPLVLGSLVTGVASMSDIKSLSRIGARSIAIFVTTTAIAATIGLGLVNLIRPGDQVPAELQIELQETYAAEAGVSDERLTEVRERGPLAFLVNLIPENFLASASDNANMLQVIIVAIVIGVGLLQLEPDKAKPLIDLFDSLGSLVIRLVGLIMFMAPLGVLH